MLVILATLVRFTLFVSTAWSVKEYNSAGGDIYSN